MTCRFLVSFLTPFSAFAIPSTICLLRSFAYGKTIKKYSKYKNADVKETYLILLIEQVWRPQDDSMVIASRKEYVLTYRRQGPAMFTIL